MTQAITSISTPSTLTIRTLITKSSAQAVWLDTDIEMQSHILSMLDKMAEQFGKSRYDISIDDVHALTGRIRDISAKFGVSKLKAGKVKKLLTKADKVKNYYDVAGYVYGMADIILASSAGFIAQKFLLSIAAQRLKRAAITYIAGWLIFELYSADSVAATVLGDSQSNLEGQQPEDFDPIAAHFTREQLATLCRLLKVECDLNLSDGEIKRAITNEFSYYTKNFLTHIYHKFTNETSPYRQVLETVCADLGIVITPQLEVADIEQKIVIRVLQETVDKLKNSEREELLARLAKLPGVTVAPDISVLATGGSLAALLIGNYAGFGTYMAASSALGALTAGLGITASFGVYTTMSTIVATALGPIGMGTAAAAFIATLTKSSPRKAIPAIVYIATMRAKLNTPTPALALVSANYRYLALTAFGIVCALIGYGLSFCG
jgi:uncharacterized protein YaaW (UPF0174 family)